MRAKSFSVLTAQKKGKKSELLNVTPIKGCLLKLILNVKL